VGLKERSPGTAVVVVVDGSLPDGNVDGVAGTVVVGGIVTGLPYASSGAVNVSLAVCRGTGRSSAPAAGSWTTSTSPPADEYAPVVGIVAV